MPDDLTAIQQESIGCFSQPALRHQHGQGIKAKESRGNTMAFYKEPEIQRQEVCSFSPLDSSPTRSLEKILKEPIEDSTLYISWGREGGGG